MVTKKGEKEQRRVSDQFNAKWLIGMTGGMLILECDILVQANQFLKAVSRPASWLPQTKWLQLAYLPRKLGRLSDRSPEASEAGRPSIR